VQIGALLRVAPGTYDSAVDIQATTIPPIQPLARGFAEVSCRDGHEDIESATHGARPGLAPIGDGRKHVDGLAKNPQSLS